MEAFAISGLSFAYPESDKYALKDINLNINHGEFITICGRSGCGKSTLLRHLKTYLTPYGNGEGQILFEGKSLKDVDQRIQASKIGFVLQNPDNQIVTDKVWHELAFGLENLGYDPKTIRLRVSEIASFFGIETWFMKDVSELSGGQKQLLNLAAVMAMQPDVLVLDEPTSQLDPIAASNFLETIKKINLDIGTTVILSEHRLEEVFPMSDRVLVIEKGSIIADDIPNKVARKIMEQENEMLEAMPSATKIYGQVSQLLKEKKQSVYPLTVKECRTWLGGIVQDKDIKFKSIPEKEIKSYKEETVIELKDIWFKYEREDDEVIKDLSLVIKKGQFHAIVGGNGAGKTTVLSLIAGINRPYRGKVLLEGKDIRKYRKNELFKEKLAVLPQDPQSLFTAMSVEKDLYEMLEDRKLSIEEKNKEIDRVVELMEINDLMHMHPYDLSGGEQQRVAMAKILLLDPEIIILDEPTKGMDSLSKRKLAKIFKNLQEKGKTIVIVSHDLEFCAQYADICSMIFNGNIVTTAPTLEFFSGNSFYTSQANKISRGIFENAIRVEDVVKLCKENLYHFS